MAMQARPQVFNHGRNDMSDGFTRLMARALRDEGFNVFIDSDERRGRGRGIEYIFRAIETSKVALVIFSERYAASEWSFHEAKKICERRREGKLLLIPVFYRVWTEDVNMFNGRFGECFVERLKTRGISDQIGAKIRMRYVNFICTHTGFASEYFGNDIYLVDDIVSAIKRLLQSKSLPRQLEGIYLPSHFDMFMPKQPEALEGFGKDLFYVSIAALFCYFLIPLVFTDLDFFSIRQWFLAVLILFFTRKTSRWILS